MNVHAAIDSKASGLTRPNGDPLRLNNKNFVAIDRDRDALHEPTYRPQALYNRANEAGGIWPGNVGRCDFDCTIPGSLAARTALRMIALAICCPRRP